MSTVNNSGYLEKINKKQIWSLQSLAAMSFTNSDCNSNTGSTNITSENASILLQDVNYRLDNQYRKCVEMIDQVLRFSAENNHNTNSNASVHSIDDRSSNTSSSNRRTKGNKKIIKAVNQLISTRQSGGVRTNYHSQMKEAIQRAQKIQMETQKVIRGLNNLKILHADTFQLTQQLLEDDNPVLRRFSPADQNVLKATFEQIRSRHASTVENFADIITGLKTIRDIHDNDAGDRSSRSIKEGIVSDIDPKLVDSFLKERLGIQLLCDHYVALSKHSNALSSRGKRGGGISIDCNFIDVLNDAILEAKHLCDANLGTFSEVYVVYHEGDKNNNISIRSGIIDDMNIPCTIIRPWVHHSLVEVLKNAMASSVEKFLQVTDSDINDHHDVHSNSDITNLPQDIYIRISENENQFITCEIMDQGIGLNSNNGESFHDNHAFGEHEQLFEFGYSSSSNRWDRLDEQQSYAMVRSPLGSLGVGLTLSRMMMQMFGGDLLLSPRPIGYSIGSNSKHDHKRIVLQSGCTATVLLSNDPTILEWNGGKSRSDVN